MGDDEFEPSYRFATDLWDGFDVVARRTEEGLQTCKDVLAFVKKRSEIEAKYARELAKLCQSATSASGGLAGLITRGGAGANEERGTTRNGWVAIVEATEHEANVRASVAQNLDEKVVQAIGSFVKDMEATRKRTVADGTKLIKEQRETLDVLAKSRSNYEKAARDAERARLAHEQANRDNAKAKEVAKLAAKENKAQAAKNSTDEDYKYKVKVANNFQDRFYTEAMPKILDDFQHLETVRIHLLKANMKKFVRIHQDVPPVLSAQFRTCKAVVDAIDNEADIEQFIVENRSDEVPPAPIEYHEYIEGGIQINTKRSSKWFKRNSASNFEDVATGSGTDGTGGSEAGGGSGSGSSSTLMARMRSFQAGPPQRNRPATAVFGVSLEEIMAKEPEGLAVPRVFSVMCDAVLDLRGYMTEGIFRVPADASTVQELVIQIDNNDYDIDVSDPNVPAAMLKLWFRKLQSPLIPANMYEAALAAGATGTAEAAAVVDTLPAINREVAARLVRFLRHMGLPEHVEYTRMTLDNLAMVFAPSFLRCPSDDPSVLLANTERERLFVLALLNGYGPAPDPSPLRETGSEHGGDNDDDGDNGDDGDDDACSGDATGNAPLQSPTGSGGLMNGGADEPGASDGLATSMPTPAATENGGDGGGGGGTFSSGDESSDDEGGVNGSGDIGGTRPDDDGGASGDDAAKTEVVMLA